MYKNLNKRVNNKVTPFRPSLNKVILILRSRTVLLCLFSVVFAWKQLISLFWTSRTELHEWQYSVLALFSTVFDARW